MKQLKSALPFFHVSGAMAGTSPSDFQRYWEYQMKMVSESSEIERIVNSSELANLCSMAPVDHKSTAEKVLLEQVAVARKLKQESWLRVMAKKLNDTYFQTREWLVVNVHPLPPEKPRAPSKMPEGPCTDIRRKENPDLPRVGEHLDVLDAQEESKLLELQGEPSEETDLASLLSEVEEMVRTPPLPLSEDTKCESEMVRTSPPLSPQLQSSPLKRRLKKKTETEPISDNKEAESASSQQVVDAPISPPVSHSSARLFEMASGYNDEYPYSQNRRESYSQALQHRGGRSRGHGYRGRGAYRAPGPAPDRRYGGYPEQVREDRPRHQPRGSGPTRSRGRGGPTHLAGGEQRQEGGQDRRVAVKRNATASRCFVGDCEEVLDEEHSFVAHLPRIFHPALTGREVACRRLTALNFLMKVLVGQHKKLQDLVGMAEMVCVSGETEYPTRDLETGMRELLECQRVPIPDEFFLRPKGNGAWSLLHWKRLLALVSLLAPELQEQFKGLFEPSEEELKRLPAKPEAFDSHCHLDRTIRCFSVKENSLQAVLRAQQPPSKYRVEVNNVVGVFCDPESFPSPEEVREWARQGVIPAIGWHPKKRAEQPKYWENFEKLLSLEEVYVFGEVGYDMSDGIATWGRQLERLERQLRLLQPKHILVLHCRAEEDGKPTEHAWLTLLYLLRSVPEVGRDRLIHCHCFVGAWRLVENWLRCFPNTYFGFTGLLDRLIEEGRPNEPTLESLRKMPLGRVLVETDAPYFPYKPQRTSTPANIGQVAAAVARVRQMDWNVVLQATLRNGRRLYLERLPPVV